MQGQKERSACAAWIMGFNFIPLRLVERAYRPGETGLRLLAGGERASDCCNHWFEATGGDTTTGFRCELCRQACGIHWVGPANGRFGQWRECYRPTDPAEQAWMREHAAEIALAARLLVFDTDDAGILLALDDLAPSMRWHWLPLYRLHCRAADARASAAAHDAG